MAIVANQNGDTIVQFEVTQRAACAIRRTTSRAWAFDRNVRDHHLSGSQLRELLDADPVNPVGNHDLSVLAVSNVALENTGAALPSHPTAGTPAWSNPRCDQRRAPCLALACFARCASKQSLSTGHVLNPRTLKYRMGLVAGELIEPAG